MNLFWIDDAHTAINVVMRAGESLPNFAGPATLTVPVDDGNADYNYIVSEIGLDEVGAPTPLQHPPPRDDE